VILGFGLWGAYGSNFNAAQESTSSNDPSSQSCLAGFTWDGSDCVPDAGGTNDPNCASNYEWNGTQCVVIPSNTDPGTNGTTGTGTTGSTGTTGTTGTSGNTNTNTGTTPKTSTGSSSTSGNTTPDTLPSATITPITTSYLAITYTGYKLLKSPFAMFDRYNGLEMSNLGSEFLRIFIRNRERGINEITLADLQEKVGLIQDARTARGQTQ